jgi:hypothetical protein
VNQLVILSPMAASFESWLSAARSTDAFESLPPKSCQPKSGPAARHSTPQPLIARLGAIENLGSHDFLFKTLFQNPLER